MASPAIWATPKQVTLSFGRTGVLIIGGGPAGLAPLLAAHRRGRLADLLEEGVTVVEQSGSVGEGTIGRWYINSDSTAFTFADCAHDVLAILEAVDINSKRLGYRFDS